MCYTEKSKTIADIMVRFYLTERPKHQSDIKSSYVIIPKKVNEQ